MQVWEGYKVGLVKGWYREDGVSNLPHVYRAGEGGFLRVVALEVDAVFLILNAVCGDGGVMARASI